MEFTEVENHDDFYTSEEGRVHVQDQRGYYVMYEAALADMKYVSGINSGSKQTRLLCNLELCHFLCFQPFLVPQRSIKSYLLWS